MDLNPSQSSGNKFTSSQSPDAIQGHSDDSLNASLFTRGLRAAVLTLGGLFAAGTTAEAMQPVDPAVNHNTPVRVARVDPIPQPHLMQAESLDVVEATDLIYQSFDPALSDYQRQRAEMELSHRDPGAKELLKIAWKEMANLPSDTPAWKREALSLFIATRELNMEFPARVAPQHLWEIIKNRQDIRPDGRPLAVVVTTKGDHNGAFYIGANMYDEMIKAGYRIVYFEAESDTQFIDCLKKGTGLKTDQEQRADIIMIGGHGAQNLLVLERGWPSLPDRHGYIDFGDAQMFKDAGISDCLKKGGQVVLDSCSNGEGRASEDNVANFMRRVFPHAKKEGIWSATESYGPIKLFFDHNNELIKVWYPVPDYRAFHQMRMHEMENAARREREPGVQAAVRREDPGV
jgi:hypothetical protein